MIAEKNKTPIAPPGERLVLSRAEAAFILGVSVPTLDRMVTSRVIPTLRMPGRSRRQFDRRALERWLANGCPRPRKIGVASSGA